MKSTKFTEIANEEMKQINGGSVWRIVGGALLEWGIGKVLDTASDYMNSRSTGVGLDESMLPSSKINRPCQHTF